MIDSSLAMNMDDRFFTHSPNLIVVLNFQGEIQKVNPTWSHLLGWSQDESIGTHVKQYVDSKSFKSLYYQFEQCLQQNDYSLEIRTRMTSKTGFFYTIHWQVSLFPQDQMIYGFGRDITASLHTEAALIRSQARLSAVLDNAPVIVYALDRDGYFTLSEGKGLEKLGRLPGEVVGLSAFEIYQNYPGIVTALRDALNGHPRNWIAYLDHLVFDCRVSLLRDQRGQVEGLIGVSMDITDRITTEKTLDNLVAGVATATGKDFFQVLTSHLAQALNSRCAMISEYHGEELCTLGVWIDGKPQDNFCFSLADAFGCQQVIKKQACCYMADIPREKLSDLLCSLGVNTYLGTPLYGPGGEVLGTLCVLNDRPLESPQLAQGVICTFAARASAELNRFKAEADLQALNRDLEARVEERTQLLMQTQAKFKKLAENVPGVIYQFLINVHGERSLLYISDRITEVLGFNAPDLVEDVEVILSRIHPEDKPSFELSVLQSMQNLSNWAWDGRFLHANGQDYCWMRGVSKPERQPNGSIIWDGILIDITDRKVAETNMQIALAKERELNTIKSRLIATTSHEFRTPLAVIASSASILQKFSHRLSEEKKILHLKTIDTYIQHTTKLLEDVLLLNRVDAGQLSFQPDAVNVLQFCDVLVEEMRLSNPDHTIQWNYHLDETIASNTAGESQMDTKLLRQILLNLIHNAVKYSDPRDSILFQTMIQNDQVIFTIQDKGIGICPGDQPHIFDPFHRGDNVGTRSGTGLGLSVVKSCVDLHRGTIAMTSVEGQGSTFTVSLPRHSP